MNTSEAPLSSVIDTKHGYIIGTQDSIVTQVQFRIILKVPRVFLKK